MVDGSIVKDFKVSKENVIATLRSAHYADYELRPYWDIRLILDEDYPGGVFGISAFIWAGTGEILYGNMATGGTVYPDNYNPADSEPSPSNYTLVFVVATVAVGALAIGLVLIKKRHK
jgi:hypothetical protein